MCCKFQGGGKGGAPPPASGTSKQNKINRFDEKSY